MSSQPKLRRTDSSTLPSLIPDTNLEALSCGLHTRLTAVDQVQIPGASSASSVTLADLHGHSIVRKGAYACALLVRHLALS